jgi:myo-inositol 2-dehydrogenase/D-chiro-inositol 1-dehydrogenase
MQKKTDNLNAGTLSRRDFMQTTAAASLAFIGAGALNARVAGSDRMKVGVIGCGGRGTEAAKDCVTGSEGVEIYSIGDLFRDPLEDSYNRLSEGYTNSWNNEKVPGLGAKFNVTKERCFVGFDAYQKVIDSGVDMVILAASPHFRPLHLRAAVEAGRHVFMEKPVAVDPAGVRSVIETSDQAAKKGLGVVAGTQRRHQNSYLEIMKRIQGGDIGEIVSAEGYWIGGCPWWDLGPELSRKKWELGWSEAEYQYRNWFHFAWLSGDIIVEQHVHNLDVINWALGGPPAKALGMGGRAVRFGEGRGDIWDHFSVMFEYPNGVRAASLCRQADKCTDRVSERIVGKKGVASFDGPNSRIEGAKPYQFDGKSPNPYVQEHTDLVASIRAGKPLNEGRRIAESTCTAIMGRMSAYTGRAVNFDWIMKSSKLDYTPARYEFGDLPVPKAAVPGVTELV